MTSRKLSQLAGVKHGFTTRHGGASAGPYTSLNLGPGTIAQDPLVEENLDLVRREMGARTLLTVKQVHGTRVVPQRNAGRQTEADGMILDEKGVAALILVADCAPVLIARKDGTQVAAVHAGWRGAVGRIASRAVELLGTHDVVAAVGPCIGPCCFEVGPEVVAEVVKVAGEGAVIVREGRKPHVDLGAVVRADLMQAGVREEDVDVLRACTMCGTEFFSHRRDHGVTGRQGGVILRVG